MDHRETRVGVFKLPSRSFAGTSAGGRHRKNRGKSESVGDQEQHTPSAGGGREPKPWGLSLSTLICPHSEVKLVCLLCLEHPLYSPPRAALLSFIFAPYLPWLTGETL